MVVGKIDNEVKILDDEVAVTTTSNTNDSNIIAADADADADTEEEKEEEGVEKEYPELYFVPADEESIFIIMEEVDGNITETIITTSIITIQQQQLPLLLSWKKKEPPQGMIIRIPQTIIIRMRMMLGAG